MKAIILAGGFGTRLQSVVKDRPKPMALVNENPFLKYIFEHLFFHGIKEVILSVGYKHEIIEEYFKNDYKGISIQYQREEEPLGTGGAIKRAMQCMGENENIFVLNGDTFFDIDLSKLYETAKKHQITLSLKPMKNFERYGRVEVDGEKILSFREKELTKDGLINAGVYVLNSSCCNGVDEDIFSFEAFLQEQKNLGYFIDDGYFIDIGIPEDFKKAQIDFKEMF